MTQVLQGLSQLFTGHLGASVTRLPLGYITNGRLTLQGSLISPLTLTMALITSRTQTNESGGFRSSYFGRSVREVHLVNEHLRRVTSGEAHLAVTGPSLSGRVQAGTLAALCCGCACCNRKRSVSFDC